MIFHRNGEPRVARYAFEASHGNALALLLSTSFVQRPRFHHENPTFFYNVMWSYAIFSNIKFWFDVILTKWNEVTLTQIWQTWQWRSRDVSKTWDVNILQQVVFRYKPIPHFSRLEFLFFFEKPTAPGKGIFTVRGAEGASTKISEKYFKPRPDMNIFKRI